MGTSYAVLTAVGEDRVGIVRDLAAAVVQAGCNIEESKMAVLGGEFAVVMLVSGEPGPIEAFCAGAGSRGPAMGLRLEARLTRAPLKTASSRPYVLESVSLDAPGIVHAVTEILRRNGVNIEQMDTETTSAPWTGATMFRIRARVLIPQGVAVADLRRELEALEQERDLDTVLRPEA